jgi:hypothetical protein
LKKKPYNAYFQAFFDILDFIVDVVNTVSTVKRGEMLDVNVVTAEKCGGDRDQSLRYGPSEATQLLYLDGILNAYFR